MGLNYQARYHQRQWSFGSMKTNHLKVKILYRQADECTRIYRLLLLQMYEVFMEEKDEDDSFSMEEREE